MVTEKSAIKWDILTVLGSQYPDNPYESWADRYDAAKRILMSDASVLYDYLRENADFILTNIFLEYEEEWRKSVREVREEYATTGGFDREDVVSDTPDTDDPAIDLSGNDNLEMRRTIFSELADGYSLSHVLQSLMLDGDTDISDISVALGIPASDVLDYLDATINKPDARPERSLRLVPARDRKESGRDYRRRRRLSNLSGFADLDDD